MPLPLTTSCRLRYPAIVGYYPIRISRGLCDKDRLGASSQKPNGFQFSMFGGKYTSRHMKSYRCSVEYHQVGEEEPRRARG